MTKVQQTTDYGLSARVANMIDIRQASDCV
jgi:hypothetical protein